MRVFTPELYVYISNSDYIFLVAKNDENENFEIIMISNIHEAINLMIVNNNNTIFNKC